MHRLRLQSKVSVSAGGLLAWLVAGRHLWSSAVAAGGFRNLDTMLFETSHKWMAHAPYAATLKVRSGLARRMRRHVRLNQALDMIRLRTAPTKQKTSLSLNSGHLPVGSHREVEVRFVGRGGLVIHEPPESGESECWRSWHTLARRGRPKSCRKHCGAPKASCCVLWSDCWFGLLSYLRPWRE